MWVGAYSSLKEPNLGAVCRGSKSDSAPYGVDPAFAQVSLPSSRPGAVSGFSERIEEIDESDESQLFLSDIQRKISEIYMLLGEIELSCSYTNKAIQSLNNETRSKKSEHLKLLIDMKANCQN